MPAIWKVSIVTPCLNAERFIRETVESVLAQDYPQIEYLVMDGGSTDATLDILREYGNRLTVNSTKDAGQADAINRGFRRSTGEIFAWLNADDTYLPGAVSLAVRSLDEHPETAAVYGDALQVDEPGRVIGPYPTETFDRNRLNHTCFICQPACFLRREAFERAGMLNAGLHYALDYDLWIRLSRSQAMVRIPGTLATSRMHSASKTLGRRSRAYREAIDVAREHFGYAPYDWIYGYCSHLLDKRDQFFETSGFSIGKVALSLVLGTWWNRRQYRRFWRDWAAGVGIGHSGTRGNP